MAVGLHHTGKSGGLAMENDEEGCAPPPTADVTDFDIFAEIEILGVIERNAVTGVGEPS